uniref:EF-hand domain-containing protein n=1 Tax=Rhizochromulina marina TaxID=1034831 RepID=A0A7S2WBC3_9STRA|mmetsp:Transcript_19697/g.57501  ORF Transcript_19697/g.57501 Transcript_19697/m.57501 type:complete len:782 (+) Transcript_19697:104-2449(+)
MRRHRPHRAGVLTRVSVVVVVLATVLVIHTIDSTLFTSFAAHLGSFAGGAAPPPAAGLGVAGDSEAGATPAAAQADSRHRVLMDDDSEPKICSGFETSNCSVLKPRRRYLLLFVALGLVYLFVGIAIVCDELFVPALEIIAERLELPNDVAGATLMAAGGSAPELATSIIGTFKRSDIGFGTIVGSAVFNVLFVIGMCAFFTPARYAPLKLTWWPLMRDCLYYILTLGTLVIFMWDGTIRLWESVLQFGMYIGYVIIMNYSTRLERRVKEWLGEEMPTPPGAWIRLEIAKILRQHELSEYEKPLRLKGVVRGAQLCNLTLRGIESIVPTSSPSDRTRLESLVLAAKKEENAKLLSRDPNADFSRYSTFRAGILQLLTSDTDVLDTAAIVAVMQVKGDVNEVFRVIDKDGNGAIDAAELRELLTSLGPNGDEVTEEQVQRAMDDMDLNQDGQIHFSEFVPWYTRSEERMRTKTRAVFDMFDKDKNGKIDKQEIGDLLSSLGNRVTEDEVENAIAALNAESLAEGGITFEDFKEWYENSLFWTKQIAAAEEAAESCESLWRNVVSQTRDLCSDEKPLRAKLVFLLSLPMLLLFCVIPDCRPPEKEWLAPFTFVGSIAMVGILSFGMVELAEIFGATIGVPDVVMGLTILAAGTSVPDLLSSVIVARQGLGDMAVSSSIGSNIFDVAVGLPIPWLAFNILVTVLDCDDFVQVDGSGSRGLVLNLIVLLCMIALVVVSIAASGWQMTQNFGFAMFIFYFVYLAIALGTTPESDFHRQRCNADDHD